MIISASRRTDIPCCYSAWFKRRVEEGYVLVRNPINRHQVSEVSLSPSVVDGFVFWSKNPAPMLALLPFLDEQFVGRYYFQYTLNGYGREMEPNLPTLDERIETFKELSRLIGKERVIWRYDPIILSSRYDVAFHQEMFSSIATNLEGYGTRGVISFYDSYAHLRNSGIPDYPLEQMVPVSSLLSHIAGEHGFTLTSCSEAVDLPSVPHGACIDPVLLGLPSAGRKDKNQRKACLCRESIDIGLYDTCSNGCRYCYANRGGTRAALYDEASPLLCGSVEKGDIITKRVMHALAIRATITS